MSLPKPKVKRRIVPTLVLEERKEPNEEIGHNMQPSVLFTEFMRSIDQPDAEDYFNRRAAELGYGGLKIRKKKAKKPDQATVAPEGAVVQAAIVLDEAKLNEFVLKYAELKKHDKESLMAYLEEQYKDHKFFDQVTQRFKSLSKSKGVVKRVRRVERVECPQCKKMVSKNYLTRHLKSHASS